MNQKIQMIIDTRSIRKRFIFRFLIVNLIILGLGYGQSNYLTDFNLARPKGWAVPLNILSPILLLKDGVWN